MFQFIRFSATIIAGRKFAHFKFSKTKWTVCFLYEELF